jgi:DNA-binding protein HU-beta
LPFSGVGPYLVADTIPTVWQVPGAPLESYLNWRYWVNKTELIDALASQAGLSKADAGRAVEALFGDDGLIAGTLRKGDRVQITGFGTFVARKRAARTGRDPRSGAAINISAANVPAFKPGQALKDALRSAAVTSGRTGR